MERGENPLAGYECFIPAANKDHILHVEKQDALSKSYSCKLIIDIGYWHMKKTLVLGD